MLPYPMNSCCEARASRLIPQGPRLVPQGLRLVPRGPRLIPRDSLPVPLYSRDWLGII